MPILVSGTVFSSFHLLIILILRTTLWDGHWYKISLHMSLGFIAANYDSQDELNSQTLHFNIWKVRIIMMPTSRDETLHPGPEHIWCPPKSSVIAGCLEQEVLTTVSWSASPHITAEAEKRRCCWRLVWLSLRSSRWQFFWDQWKKTSISEVQRRTGFFQSN